MSKIITMGEIMLRLSTPGNSRFVQSDSFCVNYGGGEANVAVSLSNYGHDAYFISRVPEHEIGTAAINSLRKTGVHTPYVIRGGQRLGIYYLETGASMRPSKVIYDRAHSSMSEADVTEFDFDQIFQDADWFHWSGITPALGEKAAQCVEAACKAAKRAGVTISCDLNFRSKLWTSEQAIQVMTPLMKYVDVCIGNEEDAEKTLGIKNEANVDAGLTDADCYEQTFIQLHQRFGFRIVASTLRESMSATHNGWKALLYDGEKFYRSKHYDICPIVDRVGAGDSFSAGLIHGLLKWQEASQALEFAVAASALKHTIPGDVNLMSEAEVLSLAQGNSNGRVQR